MTKALFKLFILFITCSTVISCSEQDSPELPDNPEGVSKCTPSVFYAQSPDFHKLGLCYYLKILYL